jgi:hypothetical protein
VLRRRSHEFSPETNVRKQLLTRRGNTALPLIYERVHPALSSAGTLPSKENKLFPIQPVICHFARTHGQGRKAARCVVLVLRSVTSLAGLRIRRQPVPS